MSIRIEQLEFKLGEWIGRQHGNQSKCQRPPEPTTGIKCSFEQITRKNSDRGMGSIRQKPDPFGLNEPDPFGFYEPQPLLQKRTRSATLPNLCCTSTRKTQTEHTMLHGHWRPPQPPARTNTTTTTQMTTNDPGAR